VQRDRAHRNRCAVLKGPDPVSDRQRDAVRGGEHQIARQHLRVTQVVNGNKGIHIMLDKRYLTRG